MTLSNEQLEWIVQEVVRRLNGAAKQETAPPTVQELSINDQLITTYTLEGRLNKVTQLTIATRAVITPAAKDLLKDRGVQLVRGL